MRINEPVTQNELEYDQHARIVSTTTSKGVITYVNKDFVEISGFTEEEALGQAHNIVRHPDMPQAAFQSLWDAMANQKPWMGIVKNRCKNGDHYWVDAFVMANADETDGEANLQSVRFKPSRDQISRATNAYKLINEGKQPFNLWHPKHWLIAHKLNAATTTLLLPIAIFLAVTNSLIGAAFTIAFLGVMTLFNFFFTRNIRQAAKESAKTYSDPLAQYIYTGRLDELGSIELSKIFMRNKLETALWRVVDSTKNVEDGARLSANMASDT